MADGKFHFQLQIYQENIIILRVFKVVKSKKNRKFLATKLKQKFQENIINMVVFVVAES